MKKLGLVLKYLKSKDTCTDDTSDTCKTATTKNTHNYKCQENFHCNTNCESVGEIVSKRVSNHRARTIKECRQDEKSDLPKPKDELLLTGSPGSSWHAKMGREEEHFCDKTSTVNADFLACHLLDSHNCWKLEKANLWKTQEGNERKGNKRYRSGNISIINISNSKYFHIGLQTTLNVADKSCQDGETRNCSDDWDYLLECQQALTEGAIKLIAVNFDENWKNFGKLLAFKEDALHEIEARHKNKIFILYEILTKYKMLFPSTSLGFIVWNLKLSHQPNVIKELAQNMNKVFP